jgi:hypothetical protein
MHCSGALLTTLWPCTVYGIWPLIFDPTIRRGGKAQNCSSVTCPWHVTGSQSVLVAAENQDCENIAAGTAIEVDGLNQALLATRD